MRVHILCCVGLLAGGFGRCANAQTAPPPIIKMKNVFGKMIKTQTYDMTAVEIEIPKLSIARRYFVWADAPNSSNDITEFVANCWIEESQPIVPSLCQISHMSEKSHPLLSTAVKLFSRYAPTLTRPQIDYRTKPKELVHVARYRLKIDPSERPIVDLSAGPLVDITAFAAGSFTTSDVDYPPSAIRNELQGDLVVMCQVQADFSVICSPISFTPPENRDVFFGLAKSIGTKKAAPPTLANGTSSIGVRFSRTVHFRLP